MVKLLLRKMSRDIRRSAAAYLIAILVVAVGFCGYCVLSIASDQLSRSRDYFFEITAFPQTFAQVRQAPLAAAGRLERIPGVERAEGRLTRTVRLDGFDGEEVELHLVSVRDGGLSTPLLSRGAAPLPGERELAVGDGMFSARGLTLGDTVALALDGRKEILTVTGSGISPENIYMIRQITDMFPDPAAYDAGFVSYDTLSALLGQEGLANEFLLTLSPGCGTEDVKDRVEEVLAPYGCISVFDRDDHLSVAMLKAELEQLEKMTSAMPFLFLSVAAIILYTTLHRLIQQQRVQAGTLMALGFSRRTVRLHYMSFGASVGVAGGLLGGLLGSLLAGPMVEWYRVYFSLPDIPFTLSVRYLLLGTLEAGLFCAAVGWGCARSLGRLTPSQALRSAAPKAARRSALEAIPWFTRLLTVPGLMAVRGLARNRRRAALALLGISCAYMITACLVSMNSLFDVFLFDYLEKTQRQDIAVHFTGPVARDDALRALRDPAVEAAEGILEFPATLRGAGGEEDCTIQGIAPDSSLCRLFDEEGVPVRVEASGIVLSRHMAGRLGVGVGDSLEIEVSYPSRTVTQARITGIIAQYMGSTAYMSHQGAGRAGGCAGAFTSVLLKAPADAREGILERLEDAPMAATVETRQDKVDKYRAMMGSFSGIMASMALLGVAIGLAVIYTSSLISFEELKREISTMMMLGLSRKQCLDVVSVGQWFLTAGAILLGIPLTMAVSRILSRALVSDLYTIPDFVDGPSMVLAVVLTFSAVFLSSRLILRKLNKMTPAELLRERE